MNWIPLSLLNVMIILQFLFSCIFLSNDCFVCSMKLKNENWLNLFSVFQSLINTFFFHFWWWIVLQWLNEWRLQFENHFFILLFDCSQRYLSILFWVLFVITMCFFMSSFSVYKLTKIINRNIIFLLTMLMTNTKFLCFSFFNFVLLKTWNNGLMYWNSELKNEEDK